MGFRDNAGRDATQAVFARILASGRLLLGIINDILDYSKIEAGKLRIEAIPVEPARVTGDALLLMEEAATSKGLCLQLRQRSPLPAVCLSDPLRIAQILVNLLSNAVKFTERGGITLEVGREGESLVFSVIDTGIGMTPSSSPPSLPPSSRPTTPPPGASAAPDWASRSPAASSS
jgi:signal transduction histidine kinase